MQQNSLKRSLLEPLQGYLHPAWFPVIDYFRGGFGIHLILSDLPAESISSDLIHYICYSYFSVHFYHSRVIILTVLDCRLCGVFWPKYSFILHTFGSGTSPIKSYPYLNLL